MTTSRQRSSQSWADIDDEERAKENLETNEVVEANVEETETSKVVEDNVEKEVARHNGQRKTLNM